MANIFPDLLIYGLAAPAILRLAVGFLAGVVVIKIIASWPANHSNWSSINYWLMGISLITLVVSGIFLILGLWTQIASLALITACLIFIGLRLWSDIHSPISIEFWWLMAAVGLSLLMSGAGWWALDWPV